MKLSIHQLAIATALALTFPAAAQSCTGDIFANGVVNGADLGAMLSYWGPRTSDPFSIASDINSDGIINGGDLGALLSNWGTCPGPIVPSWATLVEAAPSPQVVTSIALRQAITATGLAWRVRDNATQIEMLLVPPGTFQMGCSEGTQQHPECRQSEMPVHTVVLTNAFYLGRYEVTQEQWMATVPSNPSAFQAATDSPNRPVEQVSMGQVQTYLLATSMRLPSEAEWEYACRAGTTSPFYNGSSDESTVGSIAWCCGSFNSQTHVVGGKLPNALGFYDMVGNVWELVNDFYGIYSAEVQTNPQGPTAGAGLPRVMRGGDVFQPAGILRSSYRDATSYGNCGFRVARNP
jgi:formylglycine-generating enzyme required for sulfatase activity